MLHDVLLVPLADAFLQVGTWVALTLAAFGLFELRTGDGLVRMLERPGRGVLVGSLLGIVPGCGTAIVVMPLYLAGRVGYGTVVATLVANMGEASFVLLATDLRAFAAVHVLLFVGGVISGTLVDRAGFAPARPALRTGSPVRPLPVAVAVPLAAGAPSTVGAASARIGVTGGRPLVFPDPALVVFWVLCAVGLLVGVPVAFQLTTAERVAAAFGGIDVVLIVGLAGAAMTFVYALLARMRDGGRAPRLRGRSAETVMIASARQTATVMVWVSVAYVSYEVLVATTGLDVGVLPTFGILGVLTGTLVGLIPGCGPQVVLATLYSQGLVGFPALLANALSQDGDALFPLLSMSRRAAIVATLLTAVPAVIFGALAVLAGL